MKHLGDILHTICVLMINSQDTHLVRQNNMSIFYLICNICYFQFNWRLRKESLYIRRVTDPDTSGEIGRKCSLADSHIRRIR
jgi:hypothetical protein